MSDNDLIRRGDVYEAIYALHADGKEGIMNAPSNSYGEDLRDVIDAIADIPAADVKPVVRGEWKQVEVHENKRRWADQNVSAIASMYCLKCKRYHNEVYFYGDPVENVNFCPKCGADMRGNNNEQV